MNRLYPFPLNREQVPQCTIQIEEFVMTCVDVSKRRSWTGGFTRDGRQWSFATIRNVGTMTLVGWCLDLGDDEIGIVHANIVDRRTITPATQSPPLYAITQRGKPCQLRVPSTVPEMVKSGIVFNDAVAIAISVSVVPYQHKPSRLSKDLGLILESGDGHDTTFRVGTEEFCAHRSVLMAPCPALVAEILDDTPGSVVSIGATREPKAFGLFLKYLYTGDVPGAAEVLGQSYTKDGGLLLLQELYDVADKFQKKELKAMLEKRMVNEMDASTAAGTLAFAERDGSQLLQSECAKKVVSEGWLQEVLSNGVVSPQAGNYPTGAKDALLLEASRALKKPRV